MIALVVYITAGIWIIGAMATGYPSMALAAALVVALFLIAANGWNVRSRIPLVNSRNPMAAMSGWVLLLLGSFTLMLIVTANEPKRPTLTTAPVTPPPATATANAAPNIDATVQALAQVAVQATLQARPTAEPTLVPATPQPTSVTLVEPTPGPAVAPSRLVVTGAGADGVSLRATPGTGDRLKLLRDGVELIALDEEQQAAGRAWQRVKDADGTEGWIAAEFIESVSVAASVPPAPPPAEVVAAPMIPPTFAPVAAANCQFVRGFADFVKLVGASVVGGCRENEHPSQTNKDNIEQATTNGLLVWSNPKRLTMFTNGTTSWYGCGNVTRSAPSNQAFDCVVAAAPPAPAASNTSPEIAAYLAYMRPKMQTIGTSLSTVTSQSSMVESNPAVLFDSSWQAKTGVALGIMKAAGEQIQKYEPVPKGAEKLDTILVAVGQDLVYVADEYAAGLDSLNPRRIENAVQRMQSMNAKLPQALTEIQGLNAR